MERSIGFITLSLAVLLITLQFNQLMAVSLPFFLLFLYSISTLLLGFIEKRQANPPQNKKKVNLAGGAIIAFILADFFKKYVINTVGGYNLFWVLTLVSIIPYIFILFFLNQFVDFDDDKREFNILSLCFFIPMLIISLGILVNKELDISNVRREVSKVLQKEEVIRRRRIDSYYIYLKTEYEASERFEIRKELYNVISIGDSVKLNLHKGALGYDYVDDIKKY